jgi:hypothetical protein
LGLGLLAWLGPREAAAGEARDLTIGISVGTGVLAGLSSSIAAIVYAAEGRAFSRTWIALSMYGAATCGAVSVPLLRDSVTSASGPGLGIFAGVLVGALALWPLTYSSVSAAAEADFGELFEGAPPEASPAVAPSTGVPAPPPAGAQSFLLPVLSMRF